MTVVKYLSLEMRTLQYHKHCLSTFLFNFIFHLLRIESDGITNLGESVTWLSAGASEYFVCLILLCLCNDRGKNVEDQFPGTW